MATDQSTASNGIMTSLLRMFAALCGANRTIDDLDRRVKYCLDHGQHEDREKQQPNAS